MLPVGESNLVIMSYMILCKSSNVSECSLSSMNSPQTVGVIVKIDGENFKILDNNGNIQTVSLGEIGHKRNDKGAESFDAHQNLITIGDVVKVTDGQYKVRVLFLQLNLCRVDRVQSSTCSNTSSSYIPVI